MSLPNHFIQRNLRTLDQGLMIFGTDVQSMSRDELLACLAFFVGREQRKIEEQKQRDLLGPLWGGR